MDTFMDEIKNIKMLTRVVAVGVLINFAIIALLQGPDVVGFDPTYGTITSILNFVIAFCTTGVLMGIYVVFDVKKTFDLAHMHSVLFVAVCVQMIFALGSVFAIFSERCIFFSTLSKSFNCNSVSMMSLSPIGLIFPSSLNTFSSSKQRIT